MHQARPILAAAVREGTRTQDNGGTALFYALSCTFLSLFGFVLWYCPRHL